MSRSLNKVMLIGRVGVEPEVRTTPGGHKVAKCSMATSVKFKDRSGQDQEKTEWHRLTFWRGLADVVEKYVGKGDLLYIEGSIEYSQTQDDQGNTKYWTDIVVKEMNMLGSSGNGSSNGNGQRQKQTADTGASSGGDNSPFEEDDDLPF